MIKNSAVLQANRKKYSQGSLLKLKYKNNFDKCNHQNLKLKSNYSQKLREEQVLSESTNIQALYWRYGKNKNIYPSSFQLISIKPSLVAKLITLQNLQQLNFPVLSYKISELVNFATKILRTSSFCRLNFNDKLVKKIVVLISKNYNIVSYHNFSHAFSLMLLNYQIIHKQFNLKHLYTDEQYFFILIAGLCHDLNHKGTNNNYEIKLQTDLAVKFKGQSVLQNMHIRHLWKILAQNQDCNFLMPSQNKLNAKKIITRLILSTDISLHFKNFQKLQNLKQNKSFNLKSNEQDKWFMMQQIFHACDLGNACLDYNNYISWAALLSHEFNEQSKLEQKMQIQVTQSFTYSGFQTLYADQKWFIGQIVFPLWKHLQTHWTSLKFHVENIQNNLQHIQHKIEQLKQ